ncbi:MAG: mandelate racemase/muconate lactonizing enzyme family protein, partial [Mesorhizobium sp.]
KRAEGYEWFKIKVGLPRLADDVARVGAAREAIGPDAHLVLDANQGWDLGEAIRRCRRARDGAGGPMPAPALPKARHRSPPEQAW